MKIVDRKTVIQNMGDTDSVQNLGGLLGRKPHSLGLVATLYKNNVIGTLTDALQNIYFNPKKGNSYAPINSKVVEWNIDVNFIKQVKIVGTISGNGQFQKVESIILEEHYFDKNDTFSLENRQQLFVVAPPKRLSTKRWEYKVRLVASDRTKTINIAFASANKMTRLRSNYFPELSERGYTKWISNTEKHRNHMSLHRASVDFSSEFKVIYFENEKKKKDNEYYKLEKNEKRCLDNFMMARESACIFGQSNFDVQGKCLIQDARGRDVPMGDGIIAQIERYCERFAFSILTSDVLDDVLAVMREKSDNSTGNSYSVVCNDRMYDLFGKLMKTDLRFNSSSDGAWIWSKAANKKINVGSHFDAYNFQGNDLIFMPDRALSQEYPDHAYAIFLDTSADLTTGRPNIASFTLEGSEMISGKLNGMGGQDGKTSGEISTSVAGSQYHLMGYSCVVVFNPYKSFILEESVAL